MLFLPVGTGIAGALLLDGAVVSADGRAGEVGHLVVDPLGPVCRCGATGCLESIASAAAVEREYAARTGVPVTAEEIAVRVAAGEPDASAVWARAVAALAQAIAATVTITGVDLVILGGGLAESGAALLDPLRDEVAKPAELPAPATAGEGGTGGAGRLPGGCLSGLGRAVIVTVTPNAALDITYEVDELVPHQSHRITAVRQRAGGKGVNVASVLAGMGRPVIATGLLGGTVGDEIRADLDSRGVAARFVDHEGSSRRTVNVVSTALGDATVFNEPGPEIAAHGWQALVDGVRDLVADVRPAVLVLAGSLPRGVPDDGYAELVDLGHQLGARVIVDADGAVLRGALVSGPDLVAPNLVELARTTGTSDLVEGAAALRDLGARDLAVSCGADGLVLVPEQGAGWWARLPAPLTGNPTGAGDALVAALAAGLAEGSSWPQVVPDAVAWSAAAVLQGVAGEVDPDDVARLLPQVLMEAR